MNFILVKTWEYFNLSYAKTTQKYFIKTHLLPLSPKDTGTNHQACLADTQMKNIQKVDEIGCIESLLLYLYRCEKSGQLAQ